MAKLTKGKHEFKPYPTPEPCGMMITRSNVSGAENPDNLKYLVITKHQYCLYDNIDDFKEIYLCLKASQKPIRTYRLQAIL